MSHTANSATDIHLGNVPVGIEDPVVYEAILNVHSAIEALLTSFDDTETGYAATVNWLEAYVVARTKVVLVTADYTVTVLDGTMLVDTTSGEVTVTLPTAIGISGTRYVIKHTVAVGIAVVAAFGSEEIDSETNDFELYPDESIVLQSDGTGWNVI